MNATKISELGLQTIKAIVVKRGVDKRQPDFVTQYCGRFLVREGALGSGPFIQCLYAFGIM